MSYLLDLCLFAHSGVQHILCCVFVLFFFVLLPFSLDCPFLIATSVFSVYSWSFFVFSEKVRDDCSFMFSEKVRGDCLLVFSEKGRGDCSFVGVGGIVDHYCLDVLFIIDEYVSMLCTFSNNKRIYFTLK